MKEILMLLIMVLIGALIGGLTNLIAVKMLFRPHQPVYIGRWKVPFTPGLIPKRKAELAAQLGKLVSSELLTPEVLQQKLLDPAFKQEIIHWLQQEIDRWLQRGEDVETLAKDLLGIQRLTERCQAYAAQQLKQAWLTEIESNRWRPIKEMIPEHIQDKLKEHIPRLSAYLLEQGVTYLNSPQGEKQLGILISRILDERGKWLRFLAPWLAQEQHVLHFLRRELIRFLNNDSAREAFNQLLYREWSHWQDQPLHSVIQTLDLDSEIHRLTAWAKPCLPPAKWFNTPLGDLFADKREDILNRWVPKMAEQMGCWVLNRLPAILNKLKLDVLVEEHVSRFPLPRLEALVLSIARRELNMITYLGALLGGIIGLVQGLAIMLFYSL
ncbi:DUF445 domain-containing protein [Caldalkalibacillus thermarum]|uniref:DUF445 domain-containing protein n=1 Tax=Caldalkalibacillus thermarum TaxID=296745 RepID=UPI0013053392|nr:DUF445 family protein [Caldalkalibacillus thermarum]